MIRSIRITLVLALCAAACAADAKFEVNGADALKTLVQGHPRLMLLDDDLKGLRRLHDQDVMLERCVKETIEQADRDMGQPMLTYRKIGPRLLSVSRAAMNRMYSLGVAYRWTGEEKYAKKAIENMLAVCAFEDWNPSHFLDVAEMTHAVGLGYDWTYSVMDDATRQTIKAGLIRNGLEPGIKCYKDRAWWSRSEYNWNQVCNGGLIVGALAIAETDPQYAETIIPAAVRSFPTALASYGPDGAWGEGPGYWSYATHYTAYGLCALKTALGTDFGLTEVKGLAESGLQPIYMTGPTGLYLNYADSGEKAARRPMAAMLWLAQTFNKALYAEAEHIELLKRGGSPQHVVWYVPAPRLRSARQLDKYFDGAVEVAVFRSSWTEPDALFFGIKAGYNQVNHGHLDLGNFEIDALGVRWARDLGSDDYNMAGYWDGKRGGKRWSYYRLNTFSHNVVTFDDTDQDPMGKSRFAKTVLNEDRPCGIVDFTTAYGDFASKALRGMAMVDARRAVLVQDEFALTKSCKPAWGMTTDADISVKTDGSAVLTLDGKTLTARVLSPAGAQFSVESAEQTAPQKTNKGVRRLMVRLPQTTGDLRIAVLLSPNWPDGKPTADTELNPLSQW